LGPHEVDEARLREELPPEIAVPPPQPDLRDEPVVRAESLSELPVAQRAFGGGLGVVPPQIERAPRKRVAVPRLGKVRAVGSPRLAPEELSLDLVGHIGPPRKIGAEHAVVTAPPHLPVGREEPGERGSEVVTESPDPDDRLEILRREGGKIRPGQNHESTSAVFRNEDGVRGVTELSGRPQPPARRGDRA